MFQLILWVAMFQKTLYINFFFYYTEENVSDVTAAVSVKYGAIPYFDGTYNLCKMNILNCPLKAGNGSTAIFVLWLF